MSTITVQAKDQYGNDLTTGGDTVTLTADQGIGALLALGGVAFFSVKALSKGAPKIDAEKLARL